MAKEQVNGVNKEVYDELMMGVNITTADEFLEKLYAVSQIMADVVTPTLGPSGATSIIDDPESTYPSKDGWASVSRLHFSDPTAQSICTMLRDISYHTVESVGDGSTTATCIANEFVAQILEYKKCHEFRQADFLSSLTTVIETIVNALETSSHLRTINRDGDFEDIYQIAKVSTNGNEEIAGYIQKIYKETGNPNIYVDMLGLDKTTVTIQSGYRMDGVPLFFNHYIMNEEGTHVIQNPTAVYIFNHTINFQEHNRLISAIMEYTNATNTKALILAPHVDDVLAGSIRRVVESYTQANRLPDIMVMQISDTMKIHKDYIRDFAMITNARIIDYGKVRKASKLFFLAEHPEDEWKDKFEDGAYNGDEYAFETPLQLLEESKGMIVNATVSDKYILVRDFENIANPTLYHSTLMEAKATYDRELSKASKSTTTLIKDLMDAEQRYIRLSSSMGVISIGGRSNAEKRCLKDSIDDAVLACRSAYNNGYITGMNLTTLKVIRSLIQDGVEDETAKLILEMMYNVFYEMSLKVMRNKYATDAKRKINVINPYSGESRVSSMDLSNTGILDCCIKNNYGYNLVTNTIYIDEMMCDVVNSVSTDIEIIRSINSSLSLLLTSTQVISSTAGYNKKASYRKALERKKNEEREITEVTTQALIDSIKNAGLLDAFAEKLAEALKKD